MELLFAKESKALDLSEVQLSGGAFITDGSVALNSAGNNTDLHAEPGFDLFDQRTESRKPVEIPLGDDLSIPTEAPGHHPSKNRCRKKTAWQSGANGHDPKQPDERINLAAAEDSGTFPSRTRVKLPIRPSSFKIQPSSAPLSPRPPHSPAPTPAWTLHGAAGEKANS
jgi:hypothetical protein